MFELGIPLDPETERWILASRQSGVGVGGAAGAAPPPDGAQAGQHQVQPVPATSMHDGAAGSVGLPSPLWLRGSRV